MTEIKKPIKRILMLADFACSTGFAQVAQNIVTQTLQEEDLNYQIDVVGINYFGMPSKWQDLYPKVRIFPAQFISGGDVFGRKAFINLLSSGAYDLAWVLQDTFNIEIIGQEIIELRNKMAEEGLKLFKWIYYFPIDASPKENWVTKSVSKADIPVVYTKYGYDECIKKDHTIENKLKIINHGINEKVFYPADKETVEAFRKDYFMGLADDKFLVVNLNRNQPRKDIARTMMMFKLLKQRIPNALLYLHMKSNDVAYDLHEVARNFELTPDKDYIVPKDFNEHDGIDVRLVNLIYNSADVLVTTTLGEGWGLSLTEAMACKCPIVAPNHTSITEILADNRGLLVDSGRSTTDWVVLSSDNERLRPVTNVADMVEKVVWVRDNPEKVKEMTENAYKYLISHWTWDIIGQQWRNLFKSTLLAPKIEKVGRNDPCPCGSGKKWKHCHGIK